MQKHRPSEGDPGLPVLKIRELGQGYCGNDSERCTTDIDGSVTIDDGDLVFSWSGTLLLRFWAGGRAGLNQHLFKVTSEQYPSWFYYAWTKHHLARFVMLAKDRATTMGHIKRSALAESSVVVPPARILEQQTKLMQPIVDEIVSNMVENRQLALLRDALLPKLMSGEIDVSKVDLTQLNSHLAQIRKLKDAPLATRTSYSDSIGRITPHYCTTPVHHYSSRQRYDFSEKLNADYRICDVFPEPTIRRLYLISNLWRNESCFLLIIAYLFDRLSSIFDKMQCVYRAHENAPSGYFRSGLR